MPSGRQSLRWVWLLALLAALQPCAAVERGLQAELDLAAHLSATASWQATQVVLDRIMPRLEQASAHQYAEFKLLHSRNVGRAGRIGDALEMVEDLLQRPMTRDQSIRAFALGANITMIARRYERAFELISTGLSLASDLDDPDGLVVLLSAASYMHAQAGQPDRAIEYGLRSLEFASQSTLISNVCISQQRLGYAYKMADDFEAAERGYRSALEVCTQAEDPLLIGVVQYGLADLLRQHQQYDEAERLFDSALAVLEKTGYSVGIAEANLYMARLYMAQGRLKEAERVLAGLVEVFRDGAQWDFVADSQQMLATISQQRGDPAAAADLLRGALDARGRHVDRERALHLAYLGVEFDLKFKQQELALLREESRAAALQEAGQRQQRRLQALGGITALLVALVLGMLLVQTRRERQHFRDLSQHDGLTGLNNHTRFFELVRQHIEDAERHMMPLTLVFADIDLFKQVNDQHGHQVGDVVLRQVSSQLRDAFSNYGTLGRIGGEEFGICIPGRSIGDVRMLVERFRGTMNCMTPGPTGAPVTLSYGIAEMFEGECDDMLGARADDALYQAKRAGRDRVALAGRLTPSLA